MNESSYEVKVIGKVESPLTDLASAPKQADEGAPDAWLVFEPAVLDALEGIRPGDEVVILTWLHHAHRDVLRVHPRGDLSRAQQGVFSTRSPHRPNPIGLHPVEIVSIEGGRVRVRNLEAIDGTPIVDLKPVLSNDVSRRWVRPLIAARGSNGHEGPPPRDSPVGVDGGAGEETETVNAGKGASAPTHRRAEIARGHQPRR